MEQTGGGAAATMFLGWARAAGAVICCLAPRADEGASPLTPTAVPGISLLDLGGDRRTPHRRRLRCFAGYSGWRRGPARDEIDRGGLVRGRSDPGSPFVSRLTACGRRSSPASPAPRPLRPVPLGPQRQRSPGPLPDG